MSTQPWRGTLIFAGTLAAIAATAAARFSGSDGLAASTAAQTGTGGTSTGQSAAGTTSGSTGTSSGTSGTSGSSSATGTQSGTTSGSKTIVGASEQTPYGPVQVSVTFTNGKITSVQALQTPGGHGESVRINSYAVPVLNKEAVAANSANIDTVSGATFTSQAYAQSLQSAIDKLG